MMDHVARHAKDKPGDSDPLGQGNKSDGNDQGSYYYDDSSNYEVYREPDDEIEELPSPTDEPAD